MARASTLTHTLQTNHATVSHVCRVRKCAQFSCWRARSLPGRHRDATSQRPPIERLLACSCVCLEHIAMAAATGVSYCKILAWQPSDVCAHATSTICSSGSGGSSSGGGRSRGKCNMHIQSVHRMHLQLQLSCASLQNLLEQASERVRDRESWHWILLQENPSLATETPTASR